jgi:putative copper export protein
MGVGDGIRPASGGYYTAMLNTVWSDAGGTTMIVERALTLAATAGVIGACLFRWSVVQPASARDAITGEVDRVVAGTGLAAALVLALVVPFRIMTQAALFASPGDALMPLMGRVLETTWGRAAGAQGVAAAVAAAGFAGVLELKPWGWRLATRAALLLAIVPAWMGHAAATESWPKVAIGADILHVAAAGGWAGGVIILSIVVHSLRTQANGGALAGALIARFRTLALVSAGVLLATGAATTLLRLRTPADFLGTPYGLMLFRKLVVIGAAVALGWRHSRTASARATASGARAVAGSIAVEALLFVAVLALTAVLAGSPPPGSE